jgi:hypothetical protein
MKLKLFMVFIGVVVILLMAGLEIVQGEDVGYPAPIEIEEPDYPPPLELVGFYITSTPEPPQRTYIDDGGYPVSEIADYSVGYPYPVIEPEYVNGRNLWQEIVYQFSKLLELMK